MKIEIYDVEKGKLTPYPDYETALKDLKNFNDAQIRVDGQTHMLNVYGKIFKSVMSNLNL